MPYLLRIKVFMIQKKICLQNYTEMASEEWLFYAAFGCLFEYVSFTPM